MQNFQNVLSTIQSKKPEQKTRFQKVIFHIIEQCFLWEKTKIRKRIKLDLIDKTVFQKNRQSKTTFSEKMVDIKNLVF